MNVFEMVVAIVAIGAIASVLRARYGVVRTGKGERLVGNNQHRLEAEQLREEVRGLKERVAVLERLATEDNSALEREFEKLRKAD